jgi:hypothetical protein
MESNRGAYTLVLYQVNKQQTDQGSKQMLISTQILSY